MEGFKLYTYQSIKALINLRKGETKFGEKLQFIQDWEDLKTLTPKYVLFGIPEDIGVRANMGTPGTSGAWKAALKALVNTQANRYTFPQNTILLGEVDCNTLMEKADSMDREDPNYFFKLGDLVTALDSIVSSVVNRIISAGKIPVIIGGGHNNAYGNIKGASMALQKALNIINIDAHTDLRSTESRHSGNGFSLARKEKFLGKYLMFGIHKNYTPSYIFDKIDASPNDQYRLFEHLMLKSSQDIKKDYREDLGMIAKEEFGLELDCDAIRGFPSSAKSPSGFSFNMVRNFVSITAEEANIKYFHICEAAPSKDNEAEVGKALSYLITDFINKTHE